MRERAGEPRIWDELYDRYREHTGRSLPPRRSRAEPWLPADSALRLTDAALGVVGSIRTLVDVAEDVLRERRDRLEQAARAPAPAPERRDEANGVHDIPFDDA